MIRLVRRQPFFGGVLLGMNKRIGTEQAVGCATAGVFVRADASIGLVVNEQFFGAMSATEQEAVLIHECLHVINLHLVRGPMDFDDHELANVAMDIAINQYIEGLPPDCLELDSFPQLNLPPEQTADTYYEMLSAAAEQTRQHLIAAGIGPLDDHSWEARDGSGTGHGVPSVLVEAACRSLIGDAVADGKANGSWGSLSASLQRLLLQALEAKVDWRRELRRFVGERIRLSTRGTRKKPHRRFGWNQPGRKTLRGVRIVVAVDTSGSIGAKELSQFLAEIDAISNKAEVYIAEVDAAVHRVYKYERQRKPEGMMGGGGTSFQVLWDAIEQQSFPELRDKMDAIIYLTDGYAPWPRDDGGIDTLWVFTTPSKMGQEPFGRAVFLDIG